MLYAVDQAKSFGKWQDDTSRFMYHDVMPLAFQGINTGGHVADYGGGNGLIKEWIPQAISIDHDASKGPDVVGNILTHEKRYDLVVMRYVLHYLTDDEVCSLLRRIAENGTQRIFIIQFANEDKAAKLHNSVNETKYFRTRSELRSLFDLDAARLWAVSSMRAIRYNVDASFYVNRLQHPNPVSHEEELVFVELRNISQWRNNGQAV